MSKISILHISDLHKTEGVTYDTLLDSLCDDKERWKEENIQHPDFIVISGDLIQGAYKDEDIQQQYAEVSLFLEKLVEDFLDGDKSRLIMVPGNHDVNRACTTKAMTEIKAPDADKLESLKKEFWNPASMVRFDWKTMNFFQIDDCSIYDKRFLLFKQFYDTFYAGLRVFPTNSTKEAYVCKFEKQHIAFACFNSCNLLDDKNVAGDIDEDSITSISSELRKLETDGYLIIGVWHHHYYGDPYTINYMSRDIFWSMAAKGIRMGLFGHQHKSEVADEYISPYFTDETQRKENMLLLISSGTLFGGEKQLLPGFRRQYNIIEIERQGLSSKIDVSINVREDNSRKVNSKIPFWASRLIKFATDNKIHKQVYVKGLDLDDILLQITKEVFGTGNYELACRTLVKLGLEDKSVRDLFDDFLQKTSSRFRIEILQKIEITSQETILLLEAILNEKDKVVARKVLHDDQIMQPVSSDVLFRDLREQLAKLIS